MRRALAVLIGLIVAAMAGPAARADVPTFDKDVAPIVYASCVSCHRAGEVAPFALQTYADVKKRASLVADVTGRRYMPPWKPEPGYGHFTGERRLTDRQVKTIADWVAGGTPEGEAKDLPPAPAVPAEGWKLGKPDRVVSMPTAFTLPADGDHGRDVYRAFVLPMDLAGDEFVTAVEFRPENRAAIHHALFFLDGTGAARLRESMSGDGQPGYATFGGPGFLPTGSLGGWAPGASPEPLPDGWGRMLRKGSDLVVQLHLHPTGKAETVRGSLGLYLAKKRPDRVVAGGNAHSRRIDIAPGDANYVVTADYKVPVDVDLIGITPHAHLICRDMHAWATLPNGGKTELIWIKDWDFDWQGQYRYAEPVRLPAGTVVEMRYVYDNTGRNPRNPNTPPKRVRFGEQTTDEMAFLFLEFSPVRKADWATLRRGRP